MRPARLPTVLIVDPIAASRFTMWRLLSRSFGVLEAEDARHACEWLDCRKSIDALIVRKELPDAHGNELHLEFRGRHVADGGVAAAAVVEDLDEFEDRLSRVGLGREATRVDAPASQV